MGAEALNLVRMWEIRLELGYGVRLSFDLLHVAPSSEEGDIYRCVLLNCHANRTSSSVRSTFKFELMPLPNSELTSLGPFTLIYRTPIIRHIFEVERPGGYVTHHET